MDVIHTNFRFFYMFSIAFALIIVLFSLSYPPRVCHVPCMLHSIPSSLVASR
ncbi:hypothetical protein DL93DRAFT_2075262 [Clavulina sp. PMI_390]|nr:hypothetical protein DL93DRAFT_2075262 [Clavulina sp. PMI_390]